MTNNRTYQSIGLVIALIGLAVGSAPAEMLDLYELIELDIDGATQTRAYAINDNGQVIGWAEIGENRHSAHWHNETGTDLHGTVHFQLQHPLFDQDYSESYDISNAGQVVGTARTIVICPDVNFVVTHGMILRPAVLTDLATPYPGDALINLWTFGSVCPPENAYDSAATGISNANHVVGWADAGYGIIRAFLIMPLNGEFYKDDNGDGVNDLMTNLQTLIPTNPNDPDPDPVSSATAVNDSGVVTGYSYNVVDGLAAYRAFRTEPVTDINGEVQRDGLGAAQMQGMQDIGTLGGLNSWGRDVNNDGAIIGESNVVAASGEHYTHAFYWFNNQMTDLGTLRSDNTAGFSSAAAINDNGIIVGWAENDDRERRAFIYENGEMKDLNTLLYLYDDEGVYQTPSIVLTEARDINGDGLIVGWGDVRNSSSTQNRAFLLVPVTVDSESIPDPNDTGTGGSGGSGGNGGSGSGGSGGTPLFGVPSHVAGDASDPNTPTTTPAPALCGPGALAMMPLTIAGLLWLRPTQRR